MISAPAIVCPIHGCSVLQVSGTVTVAVGKITLDPAFDLKVPANEVSLGDSAGPETLEAFDANGTSLFRFRFDADGPYQLNVPVTSSMGQSITTLQVSTAGIIAVQRATTSGVPTAEAVAANRRTVIFAWDAQLFPSIRISMRPRPGGRPGPQLAMSGNESYQQITVLTGARHLIVNFSDGVRSVQQTIKVFGR